MQNDYVCLKCLDEYDIKYQSTKKVKINMKAKIKESNSCNITFVHLNIQQNNNDNSNQWGRTWTNADFNPVLPTGSVNFDLCGLIFINLNFHI